MAKLSKKELKLKKKFVKAAKARQSRGGFKKKRNREEEESVAINLAEAKAGKLTKKKYGGAKLTSTKQAIKKGLSIAEKKKK